MPGSSPDPRPRSRTRSSSRTRLLGGALASFAALLVLAACAPTEQEVSVFDPWYPAENEVLGKGTYEDDEGQITVYWIVWREGVAVTVNSSFDDGNECYEAATIRERLPDFCPEPEEQPAPTGAISAATQTRPA